MKCERALRFVQSTRNAQFFREPQLRPIVTNRWNRASPPREVPRRRPQTGRETFSHATPVHAVRYVTLDAEVVRCLLKALQNSPLARLRGRVPELLERYALGEEVLIDKYLRPLLDAEETKFFNEGKKRINVEALAIRHAALRTAFELHGSYAPRWALGESPYTFPLRMPRV